MEIKRRMLGILKDVTYNYEDSRVLNIKLKFSDYSLNFRLEPTVPNTSINSIIDPSPNFERDIGENVRKIEFEIYSTTPALGENYSTDEVQLKSIFPLAEKDTLFFENTLKIVFIEDTEFQEEARYSPLVVSQGLTQPLSLCPDWREITFNVKVSIDYGN